MSYRSITKEADFLAALKHLEGCDPIAFDTEFVSEHTYRPQLCLIQVAAGDELLVIDPLGLKHLEPFWELLAAPGHETIVHAGRQELVFCLEAVGRPPNDLFDVQLAAGLIGLEYPAGYGTLISRLLGVRPQKGETRTDWRKRPLSERQLEYALDDVRHLQALRNMLHGKLEELGRMSWFHDEMNAWLADVAQSRTSERWRKVAGSASLSGRSLSIVRAVWNWREGEAQRRNCPVKQVLRDDLIVELAKRRSDDPKQIAAVRGMERGDLKRAAPHLAELIAEALLTPEEKYPEAMRSESNPQLMMLGQFLSSALSSICRDAQVAPSLVGTASDVRELVAHRMGDRNGEPDPALACGWRATVVGQLLEDLLSGKVSIRIQDPNAQQPLVFERRD